MMETEVRGLVMGIALRVRLLVVAVVVVFAMAPIQAWAEIEDTETSKAIAVAYDNSGSMSDSSDKWCMAKYSLEVLASMLGERDSLTVFPMRSEDDLSLTFSVDGTMAATPRVEVVHGANLGLGHGTNPEATQQAYEYLTTVDADERYLVITTDGQFNMGNGLEDVKATVNLCRQDGIKVFYLAIGEAVDLIESDGDRVVVKQVVAADVLKTMCEFANGIFGRAALSDENFDAGKGTLTFDVPMSTLIVFAQGEGATLGLMKSADGTTVSPDVAKVRYCEEPFERIADDAVTLSGTTPADLNAHYHDTSLVNRDLMGQVGVYRGPIAAGSYTLDTSGADVIEVYYKPYVDIATTLRSTTSDRVFELKSLGEGGPLLEDTYEVSYSVVNPLDGSNIDSSLIQGASFSTTVDAGGADQTYDEGQQVTLSVGDARILSTADVPGGVRITKDYGTTHVVAEMQELTVALSGLEDGIVVTKFDDPASVGTLSISKRNGEPISDAEWSDMDITCIVGDGPLFEVEKGEIGKATLRPTYGDKGVDETVGALLGRLLILPKSYEVTCTASINDSDRPCSGSVTEDVAIVPDPLYTLTHYWWALAGFVALVTLILLYALKPRLPKRLVVEMQGDDLPPYMRFPYNRKKVMYRFAPLVAEQCTIPTASFTDPTEPVPIALPSLTIVAARGKEGCKGKAFRFDKQTCNRLREMADGGTLEHFTPSVGTVYNLNKTFHYIKHPDDKKFTYNLVFSRVK